MALRIHTAFIIIRRGHQTNTEDRNVVGLCVLVLFFLLAKFFLAQNWCYQQTAIIMIARHMQWRIL